MDKGSINTPEGVLGDAVKRYREARGMSQQDIAGKMGELGFSWSHNTASLSERGKRSVSVNEFVALAVVLRVNPGKLLVPLSDIAVGPDVVIEKDLAAPWLEGFGSLWWDAGKTRFDSDLAFEFFRRQGLVIDDKGTEESTEGDE